MKRVLLFVAAVITAGGLVHGRVIQEAPRPPRALFEHADELEKETWLHAAQEQLRKNLERTPNTGRAKNVIMFLGDGMSIATVAAARILQGQYGGHSGEENRLAFEELPFTGFSKTYCVDKQVADSACSATAYLGGVKTNLGTIGVTASVKRKDCKASTNPGHHVDSISVWAQAAGKSTGVVTTTRITHASPAGTYGHTSERDWESDHDIRLAGQDPAICPDLAYQLIHTEPGRSHKVILGGGRRKFLPKDTNDEDNKPGEREDGLHLIQHWKEDKERRNRSSTYVYNRDGLLAASKVDYLFGLFNNDHMDYHLDSDPIKSPTLSEMTVAAIKQLSSNDNGYFLFVEGGRIDQGHHATLAYKALDETVEFSEAVRAALEIIGEDTLVVVTADHAHTMSFAGYPTRGEDILGFAGNGTDGLPYSTLVYANGPSYRPETEGHRYDMSGDDRHNPNYEFLSMAPLVEETHGGEDVQVFAKGPWSHLFVGAYEQNTIPHIMAYASCIGPGLTMCSAK